MGNLHTMTGAQYYTAYPRGRSLQVVGSGDTIDQALGPIRHQLEMHPITPPVEPGYVVLLNESALDFESGVLEQMILHDPVVHAIFKHGMAIGRDRAREDFGGTYA